MTGGAPFFGLYNRGQRLPETPFSELPERKEEIRLSNELRDLRLFGMLVSDIDDLLDHLGRNRGRAETRKLYRCRGGSQPRFRAVRGAELKTRNG